MRLWQSRIGIKVLPAATSDHGHLVSNIGTEYFQSQSKSARGGVILLRRGGEEGEKERREEREDGRERGGRSEDIQIGKSHAQFPFLDPRFSRINMYIQEM